jgi:hypothetical protein
MGIFMTGTTENAEFTEKSERKNKNWKPER